MSDLRTMIDEVRRRNPAPGGGFDRLARRRSRRQRNERMLAGAVALAVAAIAIWGMSRAFLDSPPPRPADRLTPQSTRTLRHAWTAVLPSVAFSVPVAVEGRLFESDVNRVLALDAATGRVLFTGNVGPQATRPVVVGATVYVASGSSLAAFPVACVGRCPASWRATVTPGPVAALVGAPGVQALVTLGTDGSLRTYLPDCGASGGDCVPVWTASTGTFRADAPPAVDATGVSAVTTDGTVLRFPLDCAGAASCSPAWNRSGPLRDPEPGGRELGRGRGDHVRGRGGVFGADCAQGGGSRDPLWRALPFRAGAERPPGRRASGVVVVGSGDGRVYGFPLRCDPAPGGCPPAWRSPAGLHSRRPPPSNGRRRVRRQR